MKKILVLIITIFLYNCSDNKKLNNSQVIIGKKSKLEFLNNILSDTINLKLLPSQKIMISDFNFLPRLPKSIYKNDEYVRVKEIEFLSFHLKELDTLFIKRQIQDNKSFDLKGLSDFDFRILNTTDYLKNGMKTDSLSSIVLSQQTEIDKLYNGYYVLIDKPIFNQEMNRAFLTINDLHSGNNFLFIKVNGKWEKENIGSWIE